MCTKISKMTNILLWHDCY